MIFSTSVMVILTWWVLRDVVSYLMRRKRRGDYLYNDKDFISQLPDDVLILIIGRIPTRTAVSTSILSKRWRNLYKSLSSIKLECIDLMGWCPHPHNSEYDLGWMVYRLETFLRGPKIYNFFLAAGLIQPHDKRFEQCIYYLEKSNVEKLQLNFHFCWCCARPSFSCDLVSELPSLKYLGLGDCCPLLPKLKSKWNSLITLRLSFCTVVPGFWECVLSNCLNLESLIIYCCKCPPKLCIRGPSLQLKTLKIDNSESIEEIELHASNLYEFEYRTYKTSNLVYDYVPKLEIMHLSISTGDGRRVNMMAHIFGEVPKYVPSLKYLTFVTKPYFNQDILVGRSRFEKLRVLDMTIDWTPTPSNLLELIPYLQSCPVLEELQLNLPRVVGEVVSTVSNQVIEMRKLKKVEINWFCGTDNEIEFAVYILKTAPSLHQMFIRCYKDQWRRSSVDPWSEQTLESIKQRLLGQVLSPTAKLIIHH